MQIHSTVTEMLAAARGHRATGRTLALVPTMGALHEGHLDLIRLATRNADIVVVSIFVNPKQFGPNEDFSRYPRDREGDLKKCQDAGAHSVFTPTVEDLFPPGYSTYVTEESVAKPLEGVSRPTHFRGVTTVVAKLFNIVQPDTAIFGQKDAQQVAVIRKMVADLNLPVAIVIAPTTRDPDGLALSSRNRYLTDTQRKAALAIPLTLRHVKSMVDDGEQRIDRLIAEATHRLAEERRIRVIYAAIVQPETFTPLRELVPGQSLLAVAAWVDETRLLDNIIL